MTQTGPRAAFLYLLAPVPGAVVDDEPCWMHLDDPDWLRRLSDGHKSVVQLAYALFSGVEPFPGRGLHRAFAHLDDELYRRFLVAAALARPAVIRVGS